MESKENFAGFPEGKVTLTQIPDLFIKFAIANINDIDELKLLLYVFWRLTHSEGNFRYLTYEDFRQDAQLLNSNILTENIPEINLNKAIKLAVDHKVLLEGVYISEEKEVKIYFLNSSKGRAAIKAIKAGKWKQNDLKTNSLEPVIERPNIYKLYEENIGPLSPIISDSLKDAEENYPESWINDAIKIATERNKRNWQYIQAILKRWQEEGKNDGADRQYPEKDRGRYTEGEYSEFIKH